MSCSTTYFIQFTVQAAWPGCGDGVNHFANFHFFSNQEDYALSTFYISTSVPYVNAHPHIGFALELVQAHVLARWARGKGQDTFFLTGTDENAIKNVRVAIEQKCTPRSLCDRNADLYRSLIDRLDISVDGFIRTSSAGHHQGAAHFWSRCRSEDIYLKRYRGLYCAGCEDFVRNQDLQDGLCPYHNALPEAVEEENYFFRLTRYAGQLEALIRSGKLRINPDSRRNEALGWIRQGLWDFSISRPAERSAGWGIPVPGEPSQILYVWFDALTNYLTGLGFDGDTAPLDRYWNEGSTKVHTLGKDILKFHALYWPAMLLSAGLPLPDILNVHGFVTAEGRKISKSLGNTTDPFAIIEKYGADALRYYLLRAIPAYGDGDFSISRFEEIYNADLANGLGNLVRRLQALFQNAAFCPEKPTRIPGIDLAPFLCEYRFGDALRSLWISIGELNKDIDKVQPWALARNGRKAELANHFQAWTDKLRAVATGLRPFLPQTAEKILAEFSRTPVTVQPPLFPRISLEQ